MKSENADEPKTGTESALDGTAFRSFYDLKRGLSIAKLLAEKMGGMITADTLLKPLKQDAVHRCIYMAYLKNGAYTSAVEQISHLPKRMRCKKKAHSPGRALPGESPNNRITPEPRHEEECAGGLCMTGQSVEFAVQCFCRRTVIN